MRVIIAGAGEVGFHLAKLLAMEGHNITVIDLDADHLRNISNHIDVEVINGSSTSISTLTQAGIEKADLLIGVTNSEDVNLTTCIISKHLGAKKTVARIFNTEFLESQAKLDLSKLGIDELISPASLVAHEIKRLCKESAHTDFIDFGGGKLSLVGIKVEYNSAVAGKSMKDMSYLNPHRDYMAVALLRNNETIIPDMDTRFMLNDHAYFIANSTGIDLILEIFNKKRIQIKSLMILGGTSVGFHAAKTLSKKYRVKLVEADRELCLKLADMLPHTLIINADGRNVDVLEQEDLSEMDAFIAVTDNSETNIITSLVAKNHGVRKTIALVENIDYIHLSQSIGVDTLINKKLIAANFIFKYIRKGEILSLTSLHGADVEVLEYEVSANSKILDSKLSTISFPKNSLVGGVIRNNHGYIPDGDFVFKEGDHVVILAKMESIHKIENFFR